MQTADITINLLVPWVTKKRFCELTGCSPKWLDNAIAEDLVPVVKSAPSGKAKGKSGSNRRLVMIDLQEMAKRQELNSALYFS